MKLYEACIPNSLGHIWDPAQDAEGATATSDFDMPSDDQDHQTKPQSV